MMNYEWRKAIDAMRKDGYAVCVISPEELGSVSKEQAEEWMIDCINTCREITEEDEEYDND